MAAAARLRHYRAGSRRLAVVGKRLARIAIEHRRKEGVGRHVVNRPRDAPFEDKPDWREEVCDNPQRLRILIGILGRICRSVSLYLRGSQIGNAKDQGRHSDNNCSPHTASLFTFEGLSVNARSRRIFAP